MATVVWYSNPTSGNAMNFTDSNQWNQATDGSGTAGNPDSTDDKAVIQSGDTVTLDGNVTVGQCAVEGTLTGNTSFSLTLAGSDQDNNFSNNGTITNLNIIMTGLRASGDRSIIDSGSGIRDLTINDTTNSGNNVHKLGNNLSISGNLTITSGTLSTVTPAGSSVNLTVTGEVSITGTLTGNESAISMRNLVIAAAGTYSATNQTTTITGEDAAGNYAIDMADGGTFTHNNGLVLIEESNNTVIRGMDGDDTSGTGANAFYRLQVDVGNASQCHLQPIDGTSINIVNNLTVSEGICRMNPSSTTLTVGGDVSIESGGQLGLADHNAAMTFKSLTIASGGTCIATSGTTTILGSSGGFAFKNEGTFTHNSGTVKIDFETSNLNSNTRIHQTGVKEINNLEIEMNRTTDEVQFSIASGTSQGLAGNFTLTKGEAFLYTVDAHAHSFDVDGSFLVDANGTWGHLSHTGAHEFAGVRIASGGTYNATSGTTTVTNRFTGTSNLWKNDGGTFTHNNGTVKFTDNDHSLVKEAGSFYNFEQASSLGSYALLWETGGGGSCTILNNLTITNGDFEIHAAGDTLDIHGQTIINGSSNSAARFNNDKNQTATITHHGLVTIIQGTYHVEDGATVNMAGIRNVGGLVD